MLRQLHSIAGLVAALLLALVTLTGAVLSVFPALDRARAGDAGGLDVATLASRVQSRLPGVETLVRQPSGLIVAYHRVGPDAQASVVDPASGAAIGTYKPSALQRWVRNLHRKLLLDDAGRVVVGVAAAGMLFILVTGLLLLARRMGGWRQLLGRVRGSLPQRLHNETGRVVVAGLLLSAATGLLMSLLTFGWLPEGGGTDPMLDAIPSGGAPMPLAAMPALRALEAGRLRQLKLAIPGDAGDVVEVETLDGAGAIDPATGYWLSYTPLDAWQRLHATVRMLHTGDGLWWLALLLGAASAAVPLLAVTGVLIWLARRRARPRLAGNAAAQGADTVILVGSESNTTWGFAVALHDALIRGGQKVHTTSMNEFSQRHADARRLLVLTATYGDGEAPESAREFIGRIAAMKEAPGTAFAVLGFGDRQFPKFCGYAIQVHEALAAQGFTPLRPAGTVDRQSEPEFQQWCRWLGECLGLALDIRYQPLLPRTTTLRLASRTDYGSAEELTAVLRFVATLPTRHWPLGRWPRWPRFETGDLLGVLPPGSASPRYYSLASAASDGVAEICVRRQAGGACSTFLTGLQPGETIQAFVRPHENFRPTAGAAPVILIGAGTGIGPLIGFIRHNPPGRPMHLYFGVRDAGANFLYREELGRLVDDHRLRTLITAFSRSGDKTYVQDHLIADAPRLRELVAQGAQVLVCGGRRMAEGVAAAWERILAGSNLSVASLRIQGRYVEDVY
ncbi:MAG TPA: PepSY domain-containing protein [Roseateles sp.]